MFPMFEYSQDPSNKYLNNKLLLFRYSNGIQIMDHSAIRHILDHSNTRLVRYSDPHFSLKLDGNCILFWLNRWTRCGGRTRRGSRGSRKLKRTEEDINKQQQQRLHVVHCQQRHVFSNNKSFLRKSRNVIRVYQQNYWRNRLWNQSFVVFVL